MAINFVTGKFGIFNLSKPRRLLDAQGMTQHSFSIICLAVAWRRTDHTAA